MSSRCPNLPCLPGYNFNPNLGRTRFNMDPKFDFIGDGVRALIEKVKPNMFGSLSDKYPSIYPRGEVQELPGWISFDKQILCFDAFFKETLQEVRKSPFLVRKVKIYFFLEDGTITVIEPKVENSGISQGTLICRHRIRFPAPMDDNFYEILDLNIGKEVELYGRVFKITNCDKFTRVFLNRCGISVPDPLITPKDPYLELRKDVPVLKASSKRDDSLLKFLELDKKILRFFAYWDDQETLYGYLHRLEILFYLADDSIEIKEVFEDGCGNTSNFIFLKREKLPKIYKGLPGPGSASKQSVLNVLGPGLRGGRYVVDPLGCGREYIEYYKENDLAIGSVINCFGRKFVLYDCDQFTKEYYRTKYGLDDFQAMPLPIDKNEGISVALKDRKLPPWNGYGSFEDSAQNCVTVELKPPQGDFKKFLKFDREGLNSRILRFTARLISKIPENCDREFIISCYLADDTIQVFELGKRNSGFPTKTFLARNPVALPGQDPYKLSERPIQYYSQDFYIGAALNINGFKFILVDADEYALRYMELNSIFYPKSNIEVIMGKIRNKLAPIYKDFVAENMPKESSSISYHKLKDKLYEIMDEKELTEHEIITISRAFPAQNIMEEKYDRESLRAITLTELKRFLWDDLKRLREYMIARDPSRCGRLAKKECYTLLRACRLPLDKDLIERILKVIRKDEDCCLYYDDLLNFLNRDVCVPADVEPINIKREMSWDERPEYTKMKYIDWCAFNKYLDLEHLFKENLQGKH